MIAFGLFVWFCWKFVWPPLLAAMEERAQTIEQGLKDSQYRRAEHWKGEEGVGQNRDGGHGAEDG